MNGSIPAASYDERTFALRERPAAFTDETIAYYQTASYLYRNRLYREITPEEQARFSREAGLRLAVVSARE